MSFGEDLLESARQRDRDRIDAARYRWLTKHAYIGQCYTDQVASGVILKVLGCDRRVPDDVGEFCEVGKAIDAAIAAEGNAGVLGPDHQTFSTHTPMDPK